MIVIYGRGIPVNVPVQTHLCLWPLELEGPLCLSVMMLATGEAHSAVSVEDDGAHKRLFYYYEEENASWHSWEISIHLHL